MDFITLYYNNINNPEINEGRSLKYIYSLWGFWLVNGVLGCGIMLLGFILVNRPYDFWNDS